MYFLPKMHFYGGFQANVLFWCNTTISDSFFGSARKTAGIVWTKYKGRLILTYKRIFAFVAFICIVSLSRKMHFPPALDHNFKDVEQNQPLLQVPASDIQPLAQPRVVSPQGRGTTSPQG